MCSHRHLDTTTCNCLHNIQQWNLRQDGALRKIESMGMQQEGSIIENGSWNPVSGKLIKAFFEDMKDINFVGDIVTINSSVKDSHRLAEALR